METHCREREPSTTSKGDIEPITTFQLDRLTSINEIWSLPGSGRKPGSVNKISALAKDVIMQCADRLGGVDRLEKWCREDPKNEAIFWGHMYMRLLPLQMNMKSVSTRLDISYRSLGEVREALLERGIDPMVIEQAMMPKLVKVKRAEKETSKVIDA